MALVGIDDRVWMEILRNWCSPADYLAMVSTSKLQSNALVMRGAACFAVSRFHAPGFDSFFPMQQWTSVWNQCVDLFKWKGWSVGLWKHSCRVHWGNFRFVPQEPFYKCLNNMVAMHFAGHSVVSILAVSIEVGYVESRCGIRSIDALLILDSGKFAFLGSFECVNSRITGTNFCSMFVNVAAANSLQNVEAEVKNFLIRNTDAKRPWCVRADICEENVFFENVYVLPTQLVINFCVQVKNTKVVTVDYEALDFGCWEFKHSCYHCGSSGRLEWCCLCDKLGCRRCNNWCSRKSMSCGITVCVECNATHKLVIQRKEGVWLCIACKM